MARIIIHTLSFNLPEMIKEATANLYVQNKDIEFEHLIVDLGIPLEFGSDIPEDIELTKKVNSALLQDTAKRHGSRFVKAPNVGVSQNWNWVKDYVKLQDDDILLCCEPDERPREDGWVKACATVLQSRNIAWCSLMMDGQPYDTLATAELKTIGGYKAYVTPTGYNWGMGGFSVAFLNDIGGVPIPDGAPRYGWIEHGVYAKMQGTGWKIAVLKDYYHDHIESSALYREYKTDITSNVKQGQPDFTEWLKAKK